MKTIIENIFPIISIYAKYLNLALIEIYFYYSSLKPLVILLKKLSLANRNIRVKFFSNSKGRQPIDSQTVELILRLKKLNPTWGGLRISNELKKIGINVSRTTVMKYLEIYGLNDPNNPKRGPSWSEFLNNHNFKIAIDFTSLIDIFGHQLFIFVVINLDTRKILNIAVTNYPIKQWVTQQMKNALYDYDFEGDYPTLCLCDNDAIFSSWFPRMMKDYFGTKVKKIPIKMPQLNGKVERFHLSLKTEAFSNVVPLGEKHAQNICDKYMFYYNQFRTHQGINGKIPNRELMILSNDFQNVEKAHLGGKIFSIEQEELMAA